jgi:DNA polymerase III sliding clamp (beta) subunit (PCNA family)
MPEIHLPKQVLKSVVERVSGAVATSGGNVALQCFHFNVTPQALTVTASDQSNTLMVTELGEFDSSFEFMALASKFKPIVRQCSDGLVQLGLSNNTLTVVAGTTSWEIRMPSVTYPKLSKAYKVECEIPVSVLREAIKATRKSMAEDALRPSLRMLSIRKGYMTACDGSRLSQISLGEDFPKDFTTSVPYNSVALLADLVKDNEFDIVKMSSTASHNIFEIGPVVLFAKKLTSDFPNVEQLMLRPALENKQELVVDRTELVKAIDRVRINADVETDAMGLSLSAKSVAVASRDKDGNSSTEIIPSSWMGKDRVLVVNHKYLTALVRGISSDECHFLLGEDTKSRKSVLLLKDEERGFNGVIPQFSGTVKIF